METIANWATELCSSMTLALLRTPYAVLPEEVIEHDSIANMEVRPIVITEDCMATPAQVPAVDIRLPTLTAIASLVKATPHRFETVAELCIHSTPYAAAFDVVVTVMDVLSTAHLLEAIMVSR